MTGHSKAALAELIGTFTLTFIGAGAGALSEGKLLDVAIAHGFALVVIIYAWGSISGAHVNPAVTFGIALAGRMDWGKAILYWIAQFAGAVLAGYTLLYILPAGSGLGETTGKWTSIDPTKVIVIEGILTFLLLVAVFASGVQGRNGNIAGVAIGLVLTMDILAGGPLTGASMNPARTFGPAIVSGALANHWVYWVGPVAGAVLASVIYNNLFLSKSRN